MFFEKKLVHSLQIVFSTLSKQCAAEATYLQTQERINMALLTGKLVVLQNQRQ